MPPDPLCPVPPENGRYSRPVHKASSPAPPGAPPWSGTRSFSTFPPHPGSPQLGNEASYRQLSTLLNPRTAASEPMCSPLRFFPVGSRNLHKPFSPSGTYFLAPPSQRPRLSSPWRLVPFVFPLLRHCRLSRASPALVSDTGTL